jgi:hypothetical protein
MAYNTVFGSLKNFTKGGIDIINDDPKHYVFSNMFEVASRSKPWEKIAVGINQEYVLEAIRSEGKSGWYSCDHDESVLCMDGSVEINFVKLDTPVASVGKSGAVLVSGEPVGKKMGHVVLQRGHQALLPKGSAYCFSAKETGVLLQQTIIGELTKQRWAEICLS